MKTTHIPKLIETSLPLEAINEACYYEKMPGIGPHPRGIHLWWARRPLASARAVIFASMVNDPLWKYGEHPTPQQKSAATKKREELNAQIAEMVKESVASEGVINLFSDKKAAVSLFDAAFLTEIRRMKEKNLAVEILKKLLSESVKLHARKNLVKSEEFSELLSKAMKEYINGHITNEEVIKRLIELATRIKEGIDSTPKGLNEDEAAFYDALSKPEAVKKFYTDDMLIQLTKELTDQLRRNRTVDWDRRESARAHMRMLVKRLLKKYKYPPDEAQGALETVMRQCELWVDETAT